MFQDEYKLRVTDCPFPMYENYTWGPAIHETYCLHYVLSGCGYFITDNKVYSLTAGDSFIIFPGRVVQYYPDPQVPWTYTWVNFLGSDAIPLLKATNFFKHPICQNIPDIEEIYSRFTPDFTNTHARLRNDGLLKILLSYYTEFYPASDKSKNSTNYIALAKDYIETHYHLPDFSVSVLASNIGLERSYLYRLFIENEGISPSEYLNNFRMERALSYFKGGLSSVKIVAYSVGYSDPLFFSKSFKKRFGLSPTDYIKSQK